jgi:uncharacterized protein (TIGR02453 family)
MPALFKGFAKDSLRFFKELQANNNKAWFDANRARYDSGIKGPAHALMEDLLAGTKKFLPELNQGKVMRINRDIRFSRDKSPYKTHAALLLWSDKATGPGHSHFYLSFGADGLVLGNGLHGFENNQRDAFRKALVDPKKGAEFTRIAASLKGYQFGEQKYKKVPKGFDPKHKNAPFLLYDGIYVYAELPVPKEAYGPGLVPFCLKHYKNFVPFHQWMNKV